MAALCREVCLLSIQLWGCNYHASLALGTVHVQESGGYEASSDQSNSDAPMRHVLRTNFVAVRDNSSTTPHPCLLPLEDECLPGVSMSRSGVSTTSTSCRIDQIWLQDILQGSLLVQEE